MTASQSGRREAEQGRRARTFLPGVVYYSLCFVCLLVGTVIYLFCSPSVPFLRILSLPWAAPAPSPGLLTSFGADLCWSLALPLALQGALLLRGRRVWMLLLSVGVGAFYETLQGFGLVPGTYDPLDYVVYAAGAFLAVCLIRIFKKKNETD